MYRPPAQSDRRGPQGLGHSRRAGVLFTSDGGVRVHGVGLGMHSPLTMVCPSQKPTVGHLHFVFLTHWLKSTFAPEPLADHGVRRLPRTHGAEFAHAATSSFPL